MLGIGWSCMVGMMIVDMEVGTVVVGREVGMVIGRTVGMIVGSEA